ncbi:ATP-binding protein [Streptomyces sp. NPDC056653]|uniref:ATP-binding protein n=1 Tax=Streptomyces sp. NPDC056653 TaxID=3345894 RepID=UPI0036C74512
MTWGGVVSPGPRGAVGDALRRVVRNLLDNARRHAAERVRAALRVPGAVVELTVSDDGAGIPVADRTRVFERFTRLDEARFREAGCSGLGRAIVGKVVTAHGGTAYADEDPPPGDGGLGGARLVVRLPSHTATTGRRSPGDEAAAVPLPAVADPGLRGRARLNGRSWRGASQPAGRLRHRRRKRRSRPTATSTAPRSPQATLMARSPLVVR